MMKRLLIIFFVPGLLVLNGCSYIGLTGEDGMFRDRQGDYLEAPIEPEMSVPGNLDSYTLDQLYVIPDRVFIARENYAEITPRPQPLDTNRPEGVVIRRVSGENWIVIAAAPGQVWPRVRDFLVQEGIDLEYENPVEGIMETTWQSISGSTDSRDKYRIRIEPGLHAGSSEVLVVHVNRPWNAVGMDLVIWPRLSDSEDKEYGVLQRVSQYLADRTDIYSSSSSSLLAGNIAGERKASMLEVAGGDSILELRISRARAWVQIGQALERAGISILDRNQDSAIIDVEFSGIAMEDNSPGFFSRLFRRNNNDDSMVMPKFRLTIEETQTGIYVSAEATEPVSNQVLEDQLLQAILNNLG